MSEAVGTKARELCATCGVRLEVRSLKAWRLLEREMAGTAAGVLVLFASVVLMNRILLFLALALFGYGLPLGLSLLSGGHRLRRCVRRTCPACGARLPLSDEATRILARIRRNARLAFLYCWVAGVFVLVFWAAGAEPTAFGVAATLLFVGFMFLGSAVEPGDLRRSIAQQRAACRQSTDGT